MLQLFSGYFPSSPLTDGTLTTYLILKIPELREVDQKDRQSEQGVLVLNSDFVQLPIIDT